MRSIFCGNFEYDARQSDLERLFQRYGRVDRVDMKSGFAFVYMVDERDAEDAIRGLDRIEFGRKGRRLRVEWTKQERSRKPESSKASSGLRPSKTLFVINFDPYHTRTRDLERHFDPYGKILNVRIRRNFAFVQYESQEDATKALDATNLSKLLDRVITVEYAVKDDDDRRSGYSPDRSHGRSPKRSYDGGRSPSPYGRERASPDYGRGHGRSPYRRERVSPNYGQGPCPVRSGRERNSEHGSGRQPSPRKERNSDHSHGHSPSPRRERLSSENGHNNSPRERRRPKKEHDISPNPQREKRERMSPDDYRNGRSPSSNPELTDSPGNGGAESPLPQRQRSRTPPARERSQS
ncbi:unnamed protein product [Coffea canephora]|uniref:RRM domain-containing protein n=1 Tax=Coffea canephora TaxID=49390 RepID=A0A068U9V3_COFCA|nr:unnamed protein product [Coffea canephora]